MPIIFDIMAQIQQKVHFWIALINTFRMIYNLFGFAEVRIFPLFLVMMSYDVISCHMIFKFAYFVELLNELSACQVPNLYVVVGKFYRKI